MNGMSADKGGDSLGEFSVMDRREVNRLKGVEALLAAANGSLAIFKAAVLAEMALYAHCEKCPSCNIYDDCKVQDDLRSKATIARERAAQEAVK